LITYALRWLRDGGLARATVCTNSASRGVRASMGDGAGLSLRLGYHEDPTPRGTAGCVRDACLGLEAGTDTLVIADGTAIPATNIGRLLDEHRRQRAALTVVVHPDQNTAMAKHPLSPDGLYVMDRRALDLVPATGFQDIKENLIPRLYRAGGRVVTHAAERPSPRVINAETYLAVNHWAVSRLREEPEAVESWGAISATGDLIAHPTASVHPSVRVIGPVLLGSGARILAGATLVGPASLGALCTVGEGAMVSRSVAWNRCTVGAEAVVDGCVLADEAVVAPGESLFHVLKVRNTVRRHLDTGRAPAAPHADEVRVASEVPGLARR
jgi:mannose-1-phosphate guanylyltransferase